MKEGLPPVSGPGPEQHPAGQGVPDYLPGFEMGQEPQQHVPPLAITAGPAESIPAAAPTPETPAQEPVVGNYRVLGEFEAPAISRTETGGMARSGEWYRPYVPAATGPASSEEPGEPRVINVDPVTGGEPTAHRATAHQPGTGRDYRDRLVNMDIPDTSEPGSASTEPLSASMGFQPTPRVTVTDKRGWSRTGESPAAGETGPASPEPATAPTAAAAPEAAAQAGTGPTDQSSVEELRGIVREVFAEQQKLQQEQEASPRFSADELLANAQDLRPVAEHLTQYHKKMAEGRIPLRERKKTPRPAYDQEAMNNRGPVFESPHPRGSMKRLKGLKLKWSKDTSPRAVYINKLHSDKRLWYGNTQNPAAGYVKKRKHDQRLHGYIDAYDQTGRALGEHEIIRMTNKQVRKVARKYAVRGVVNANRGLITAINTVGGKTVNGIEKVVSPVVPSVRRRRKAIKALRNTPSSR